MPELRWTLLVVGVLFVVALAWWELGRKRHVRGQGLPQSADQEAGRDAPTVEGAGDGVRSHREPILTLPELRAEARFDGRPDARGREAAQNPRVVEINEESFDQLEQAAGDPRAKPRVRQEVPVREFQRTEPTISDVPEDTGPAQHAREQADADEESRFADEESVAAESALELTDEEPLHAEQPNGEVSYADAGDATPEESGTGFVRAEDEEEPRPAAAVNVGAAEPPIVEWPGEETRRIVALRLVSGPTERFQGRAVRLALASEGFVLGKFDIFHKSGPDARAMLSAASLTKPGTFAMSTIDAQRFGGLSLFAVLPGPLPPQETFDELLLTARNLNDRLQGALQDERGEPLTPVRSASIRESLGASFQRGAAGVGAESGGAGQSGSIQ